MNFDSCSTRETAYPCSIFIDRHPSTVSMTVLVVVEMFNALNNLSENQSLWWVFSNIPKLVQVEISGSAATDLIIWMADNCGKCCDIIKGTFKNLNLILVVLATNEQYEVENEDISVKIKINQLCNVPTLALLSDYYVNLFFSSSNRGYSL